MTTRVLITGIGGFSGRHLAALLQRRAEFDVYGLGTAATTTVSCNRYLACDLTDVTAVDRTVGELRPDIIFHLAARTVGTPQRLHDVNVGGFVNLCNSLRRQAEKSAASVRLLAVGSAAELGVAGMARLPVREDAPCRPETAYGKAKLEATKLALSEPAGSPLQIIVARTFNLVGPGLGSHLALGRFVQQLAAYRRGEIDRVRCGNPAARRDFVDVRDAAEAYLAIVRQGRPGQLYNVCTGRSHVVGDLFERLTILAGFDVSVEHQADLGRIEDPSDVYGDTTKTASEMGWRAATPIDRSLQDLLTAAMEPECASRVVADAA